MPDTLKTVRTSVLNWLRGDYALSTDVPLINEAINDALEKMWNSLIITQYERFFGLQTGGAPPTFSAPSGAQRVQLTGITTPTVAPVLTAVAGGSQGARSVTVAFTWITESGSETQIGLTATIALGANQVCQVTAPAVPTIGFPPWGWNIYATGNSNNVELMCLQNQGPQGLGLTYTEPTTGFQDYGTTSQYDQRVPETNTTGDNIAWIDHMEIQTSDTLYRAWNQTSVDSEVMRRMARTLSSASEYQHYVWDLIGDNVIEIRPPLGLAFTPRYWPVVKTRRLAYDQAPIPFQYINGVREHIVSKAVANLKLGIDEYLAFQAWDGKAMASLQDIKIALTAQNWKKDSRIVPHLW
jgi:hypothetical protein